MNIPQDKWKHFCWGFIVAAAFAFAFASDAQWQYWPIPVLVARELGFFKELIDSIINKYSKKPVHSVEFDDMLWTAAGGVFPSLVMFILWLV